MSRTHQCFHFSYFEDNQFLGDLNILADAGAEAGFDRAAVLDFLEGAESAGDVYDEVKKYASTYRINGVPFFIVKKAGAEKKIAFSGAQDEEFWQEALEELNKLQ